MRNHPWKILAVAAVILGSTAVVAAPAHAAKRPTLTVKILRMAENKTYRWSQIATTNSKGKQSWKVVSGKCKVSLKKKTVTTTGTGSCNLRISVAKRGKFSAAYGYQWFDVVSFPTPLPQPVISDAAPAATRSSYDPGYFTGSLTFALGTLPLDSTINETTERSMFPDVGCYASTSKYASYDFTHTFPDGSSARVKGTRSQYSGDEVTGEVTLYGTDDASRRFVYSKTTPASQYSPDEGSGTLQVSFDGSGIIFNFTAVEEDANGNTNPASTVSVAGYLSCSYAA